MSLVEEKPAGTQLQQKQLSLSSSAGTLTSAHLSPHSRSHQPGVHCCLLASPCRSGTRPTKPSHLFGTHALAATAPGKVLGSGFRHGAPQGRMPKGSSPSSSARHSGPPQDPGASSDPCVRPGRMWTTSTTARTAGSSTCWTSATWRAGESPAVPPALPHATPTLVPIHPVNSRFGPTHSSAHVRSFYCFTRSKGATSAA